MTDGADTAEALHVVDGLPDVVWSSSTTRVVHGSDPGGFYCEHCFYAARVVAAEVGSSVFVVDGHALVGFLHVPKDEHAGSDAVVEDQLARHAATIDVVVAALLGFTSQINREYLDNHEPVRVLLTGYAEWGTVKNNPTGDLLRHDDNIAAIRAAMPDDVEVHIALLPVDDAAIDGGPLSIQHAINVVKPHAILSLGVHNTFVDHLAEHQASDRGLVEVEGGFHRDPEQPARTRLPSNPALARALLRSGTADVG